MKRSSTDDDVKRSLLILQQRRLHHVTSLCIRNMTISLPTTHDSENLNINEPLLYFTLHSNSREGQDEIFKSEAVRYSPNPTWSSIAVKTSKYFNLSGFTIRLWIGSDDNYMPALQWEVALKTLNCIGNSLFSDHVNFHSNAIVFGLHGFYYGHSTSVTLSQPVTSMFPTVEGNDIRRSYGVFALRRIISCKSATLQHKLDVAAIREEVKKCVNQQKEASDLEKQLENIRTKITRLRKLVTREQVLFSTEKDAADLNTRRINEQEENLETNKRELDTERSRHKEQHHSYLNTKVNLTQIVKQLALRRRDILSELSLIFPISKVRVTTSSKHSKKSSSSGEVFTICNVPLPESESFVPKEDLKTAIALGYTSQLLLMLSHFTLVPLRYPITTKASQPCIVDEVTEKLNDRERIFPFVVKTSKERFIFEYGAFLLNKNVAQLRYFFNIGTADLRTTLENIKTLLERLGAKAMVGHHSHPININSNCTSKPSPTSSMSSLPHKSSDSSMMTASNHVKPSSQIKVNQFDSISNPQKLTKRMETRNSELLNLRGELLGSKEISRQRDRSPRGRREDDQQGREDDQRDFNSDIASSTTAASYRSNIQDDSIESIVPSIATHRTHLTGLEEIGQTKKKVKVPLATARAELLGKKSNWKSTDSDRWGRRATSAASEPLNEKRSALFGRSAQYSDASSTGSSSRAKADTLSSNSSETSSFQSKPDDKDHVFTDDAVKPPIGLDQEPTVQSIFHINPVSATSDLSNVKPSVPLSTNRNVFEVDPESQVPAASLEDDLDLC